MATKSKTGIERPKIFFFQLKAKKIILYSSVKKESSFQYYCVNLIVYRRLVHAGDLFKQNENLRSEAKPRDLSRFVDIGLCHVGRENFLYVLQNRKYYRDADKGSVKPSRLQNIISKYTHYFSCDYLRFLHVFEGEYLTQICLTHSFSGNVCHALLKPILVVACRLHNNYKLLSSFLDSKRTSKFK